MSSRPRTRCAGWPRTPTTSPAPSRPSTARSSLSRIPDSLLSASKDLGARQPLTIGNYPNVKALVYVAGFAPETGESAAFLSGKFPGSTLNQTLEEIPLSDGQVDLRIRQDLFAQQFAADVPRRDAALMAVAQRPITVAALNEASGEPASLLPGVEPAHGKENGGNERQSLVRGEAAQVRGEAARAGRRDAR